MQSRIPPLHPADADVTTIPNRPCDHPGCAAHGDYRAPKSRDRLNDYYWFCLAHVQEYNRSWNYCAGMSDSDVESMLRQDTCWQRPTWPLGGWRAREESARSRAYAFRAFGGDPAGHGQTRTERHEPAQSEEDWALIVLDLRRPVDLAMIKARYKILVKRHHPDANGGSREAEEKLKTINQAYSTLKACYAP